jgi:putative sigma-54 modulation protein
VKVLISGRNIALTSAIQQYVHEKLRRLEQHFNFIREVSVVVGVDKNRRISESHYIEATIQVSGHLYRFEAQSPHLYASIDKLMDKVLRGLDKHKSKLLQRSKSSRSQGGESLRSAMADRELLSSRRAHDFDGVELLFDEPDLSEAYAEEENYSDLFKAAAS